MVRRRKVVTVERRERVLDLSMTAIASVLVLTGILMVLPASVKDNVARTGCRILTLGLTNCVPGLYDAPSATLGPARCQPLSELDRVLPEVRTQRMEFGSGVGLLRHTARDGTVYLEVEPGTASGTPDIWAGEPRTPVAVLPGVSLHSDVRWRFPGGAGEESLVRSLQARQDEWDLDRGPLSLFVGHRAGQVLVPWDAGPGQFLSTLDPSTMVGRGNAPEPPGAADDEFRVDRQEPSLLMTDRVNATSWITSPLTGGGPSETNPRGAVKIGRDASGRISSLVLVIVTTGWPGQEGVESEEGGDFLTIANLTATEESEHIVVQEWLEAGGPLDLAMVLGDAAVEPNDQFARFLSNAATVTVIQDAEMPWATDPHAVAAWLARGLRTEADGIAVQRVWLGEPTSNLSPRRVTLRPACGDGS